MKNMRVILPSLCLSLGFTLLAPGCSKRDPRVRITNQSGHPATNPIIANGGGSNVSGLLQESNYPEGETDFSNRGILAIGALPAASPTTAEAVPVKNVEGTTVLVDPVTAANAPTSPGENSPAGTEPGAGAVAPAVVVPPPTGPQVVSGEHTNSDTTTAEMFEHSACADINGRVKGDQASSRSAREPCMQPRTDSVMDTDLTKGSSASSAGR